MSAFAEPVAATEVIDVVLVENDDDEAVRVSERLGVTGFATTRARTLAEALTIVEPDARSTCVLLDLSLTDGDGFESLERLQRHAPRVPVVVLTGATDETAGLQALAAGAQDYLVKGRGSADAVGRAIRQVVGRRQTESALAEVQERFHRAFEVGPLGIALVSYERGERRIVDANLKMSEMLGRPAGSLIDTRIEELTHWQDRADQVRLYDSMAAGALDRHSGERRLVHAEGDVIWCTVTESVIQRPSGQPLYGIVLVDDVTDRKLQEEALREAHLALDTAVLGVALVSLTGRIRTVNPFYASAFGYRPHELVGAPWERTVHPEDRPTMQEAVTTVARGEPATVEVRGFRKDGTDFFTEVSLFPNVSGDGRLTGFFHFVRDVGERHEAQQALEDSERRYRRIIETANDGVWILDGDDVTTFVNPRLAEMLGYDASEMLGSTFASFLDVTGHERSPTAPIHLGADPQWRGESAFRRKDGDRIWASVSGARLTESHDGGEHRGALLMVSDLTERRRAEHALQQMALHDPLTGLPNRAHIEGRAAEALAAAAPDQSCVAVLFVGLDRIKAVNDGFGHAVGDELLRAVLPRLSGAIRAGDTFGRFGGDEFVIVCGDVTDLHQAQRVADRVLEALEAPLDLSIGSVSVSASIGIAVSGPTDLTMEDLLRDADTAMCRAKHAGGCRSEVFDASMRATVVNELSLERDLRAALADGALAVHYQPIVSLPDERVVGFEALLRWQHAERGHVSPDEFIPIAERSGLIVEIGEWVLREACGQLARWTANGGRDWARIAVNVAPRQIDRPEFAAEVQRIIEETGVDAHRVDLEITETSLFAQDAALTAATLGALADAGVRVILDDFGTGYSSLSYLSRYPLGGLKLDRSFISDTEATRRPIVEAITSMAHALGHTLVGEGVETVEQASLLAALGCDFAQGYLFARPMPAHQVEEWIATRTRHLTAGAGGLTSEHDGAWMTLGEAAAAIGLSASTLRRWNDEGRIAAQRTVGGHRRFAVADLKRLAPPSGAVKLNLDAVPSRPVRRLSVLLDQDGEALLASVTGALYQKPTRGWFMGDRARRPLRGWIAALSRACRSGEYGELEEATVGLVRQAEVAGATLLECSLFVERFTAALIRALKLLPADSDDHAEVARIAITIRRCVVAER